ncbi:MAG: hypothetical protein ACLR5M_08645 [Bifidobacterium longum]
MHDSLDATLHPGGHAPVQDPDGHSADSYTGLTCSTCWIMLDATARELWRCFDVIDALDWHKDPRMEDLEATLIDMCGPSQARHVRGCRLLHGDIINGIARKIDLTLDPPEQRTRDRHVRAVRHDAHRRRRRPVGYLSRVRTGTASADGQTA